jgi:archaellum component FlaG (FlaF/FlaG flagellin family)
LTDSDLVIEPGDQLQVPRKPQVVNVLGRVYNPTGVVFNPGKSTTEYYLKKVGGPTEDADNDHIFVVQADGSVLTKGNQGFWSGGLMSANLEPGDSIVVPEKIVFTRVMKDVKDITQILFQIAVAAGVVIALF